VLAAVLLVRSGDLGETTIAGEAAQAGQVAILPADQVLTAQGSGSMWRKHPPTALSGFVKKHRAYSHSYRRSPQRNSTLRTRANSIVWTDADTIVWSEAIIWTGANAIVWSEAIVWAE
jgi:hypothetical protein